MKRFCDLMFEFEKIESKDEDFKEEEEKERKQIFGIKTPTHWKIENMLICSLKIMYLELRAIYEF